MMKFSFRLMVLALMITAIGACKKEDPTTTNNTTPTDPYAIPSNLIKIGETYVIGAQAKAVIYSNQNLFVGYNVLYTALYDSITGERLKSGHFHLTPEMNMGTFTHGAPFEEATTADPANALWQTAAVLTMPSTTGTWKFHIGFHNHKNGNEGDGELENVQVALPAASRLRSYTIYADDSADVLVSLVQPMTPKVGLNDFELLINKKITADEYGVIDHYTIEINPTMPSMGHGSPNNENPVSIGNGHYKGKTNFTMTGLWRVAYVLKKNGVIVDDTHYFDIEF